ncbi:MAG: hypothetical protein JWM98_569 [Thermoleophilia bacterium]|nr:hypothetical protein [Thermoleophilia bacterium]
MANRVILPFVAGFFGCIVLALLSDRLVVAVCVLSLVGVVVAFRAWRRVGERNLEEFQHGYTTLQLISGAFGWAGFPSREQQRRHGRTMPWDYAGVWRLGSDGAVITAPDTTVLPPGLYPSPHRDDAWEIWTGCAWMGSYRPAPPAR